MTLAEFREVIDRLEVEHEAAEQARRAQNRRASRRRR